ncbi:MAG: ubiquinone/menaquinone biosynthesis C-methylase UbiE [Candidatus Azotimanducaceae bacterium]|jgi:ubiquinone/menaquinone biosynthesis C-methylase UbiE
MIDPKELIKNTSVDELSQTAENYFAAVDNTDFLMAKPFSNFQDMPHILQNMGALIAGLRLEKSMTVLEFAAGSCWFSRYLYQAQCQTISCDVSSTALEIGRRLFDQQPIIGEGVGEPKFLLFDGYKLDLPDESVDRIVCHDAFHHIPNQTVVLAELSRVLKPGGIAGFSEPGRYHSRTAQSQSEMKAYGVLENDIFLEDIYRIAQKNGFTDIRIKLHNDMDVSIDEYQSIIVERGKTQRWLKSKFSQNSGLASEIYDHTRKTLINKTVFFLYKGNQEYDSRGTAGLGYSMSCTQTKREVQVGENVDIDLKITNSGSAKWLDDNVNDIGVVKIGTHRCDANGKLIDSDFSRHRFPRTIAVGEKFKQTISVCFKDAGSYQLEIDLVSEGICWFEQLGVKPLTIFFEVAE